MKHNNKRSFRRTLIVALMLCGITNLLPSCSTVLTAIPAEKLPEPARSQVLDAREERQKLLKQYALGSARMLEAQAVIASALGYEDEALALKKQAAALRQGSSSVMAAELVKSTRLLRKVDKKLSKSSHKGKLGKAAYDKHVGLRNTARDLQFRLLVTRAIPEIVTLVKAAKGASTMEKAMLIGESDRYLTLIADFKKIDEIEETVDDLADQYGLKKAKRKNYNIDAELKKSVPSSSGLLDVIKF